MTNNLNTLEGVQAEINLLQEKIATARRAYAGMNEDEKAAAETAYRADREALLILQGRAAALAEMPAAPASPVAETPAPVAPAEGALRSVWTWVVGSDAAYNAREDAKLERQTADMRRAKALQDREFDYAPEPEPISRRDKFLAGLFLAIVAVGVGTMSVINGYYTYLGLNGHGIDPFRAVILAAGAGLTALIGWEGISLMRSAAPGYGRYGRRAGWLRNNRAKLAIAVLLMAFAVPTEITWIRLYLGTPYAIKQGIAELRQNITLTTSKLVAPTSMLETIAGHLERARADYAQQAENEAQGGLTGKAGKGPAYNALLATSDTLDGAAKAIRAQAENWKAQAEAAKAEMLAIALQAENYSMTPAEAEVRMSAVAANLLGTDLLSVIPVTEAASRAMVEVAANPPASVVDIPAYQQMFAALLTKASSTKGQLDGMIEQIQAYQLPAMPKVAVANVEEVMNAHWWDYKMVTAHAFFLGWSPLLFLLLSSIANGILDRGDRRAEWERLEQERVIAAA